MSLRVVGAGLPRTGTTSLKSALEPLLGAPCHHMRELAGHVEHALVWRDALFAGYAAGVDWPVPWLWRELSEYHPDAVVLLSRRESPPPPNNLKP
jgi:sulfotransferase family protein